jgi:hypothetical protein
MKLKLLSLALAICLCGTVLHAQALSEQNLIDLKKAGVDKAILVQQIEKDGISFPMDAATTIRLKNLGFADEVLSALINVGSKKPSLTADDPVKTLYAQGKYPELCDYLKTQLTSNPTNYRLRTILIGALLKINQQPAALAELEKLRDQSQNPNSKPYLDRASLLVSSWQKQQEGKSKLLAALQNYNYPDADSAINQIAASPMQKQILHMLIDSYAAKFDSPVGASSEFQNISFTDQQKLDVIKAKSSEAKTTYEALMKRVDVYSHSPLVPSFCEADGMNLVPDFKQLSLLEYSDLVGKLSRLAPLSEDVMDLAFHVTLLSSKYEDLQLLGEKILAAQGHIKIPFYARDRFFTLVIDTKMKRLYTEPDPHPFSVRYVLGGGLLPNVHQDRAQNDSLSDLVPFNLAFDEIRSVSQKAGRRTNHLFVSHSYALSLEPTGVAPNYALMQFLFCTEGEEAELQATRNLAVFVLHVIGKPNLKAELADPKKASRGSGLGDALVAFYGATNGRTALGEAAMQTMADNKTKSEIAAEQQQATWQVMLAKDYSGLLDGSVFDGLDKLVEAP